MCCTTMCFRWAFPKAGTENQNKINHELQRSVPQPQQGHRPQHRLLQPQLARPQELQKRLQGLEQIHQGEWNHEEK